jgi:hypothetical protein
MSHLKKFFCCLCLLISVVSTSFPQQIHAPKKKVNSSHSQIRDKKPQALKSLTSEQRALALIGELLAQTKNFESDFKKPLKIVLFKAKAAAALWQKDEPRARRLFMETFKSTDDFGPSKKRQNFSTDENMSTTLRSQILDLALNCDTNFAEELVQSVNKAAKKISPASDEPDFNLLSQQAMLNLKLATKLVETDAPRAAQLIKASFNNRISERHIAALKQLRSKSPALADETFLHGLSVVRRRSNNLSNKIAILLPYVFPRLSVEEVKAGWIEAVSDYEPSAEVIKEFLDFVSDEFMPKTVEAQVAENNRFGRAAFDTESMKLLVKAFEKYQPERAEAFGKRVGEIEELIHKSDRRDIFAGEEDAWAQMFRQKAPDLLVKAAVEMDSGKRDKLYFNAVLVLAIVEDDLEQAIQVSEKISDLETRQMALGPAINGAFQIAIKKGELEKLYAYAKRWESLGSYTYIARLYLKQNNPQRAAQILDEARQFAEKSDAALIPDFVQIEYANALSRVDAKHGFEAMRRAVDAINCSTVERSNSSSTNKDITLTLDENGELTVPAEFGCEDGFAALGRADFNKALALAKTIRFKHWSALAQLAVCRGILRY